MFCRDAHSSVRLCARTFQSTTRNAASITVASTVAAVLPPLECVKTWSCLCMDELMVGRQLEKMPGI